MFLLLYLSIALCLAFFVMMYYLFNFHELPQFWHIATLSLFTFVLAFGFGTRSHKPNVVRIRNILANFRSKLTSFVFNDVCLKVTFTLLLPQLLHSICAFIMYLYFLLSWPIGQISHFMLFQFKITRIPYPKCSMR